MRKITLLLSFVACVVVAQAQLLVKENFDYTAASGLIGQGGWVGTGSTPSTTNPVLVTTATTLAYSGYPASGIGNEISLMNNGQDVNKSYGVITTGFIYYSALINFSAALTGDYFLHIGDGPTGSTFFGRVFAKLDAGKVAVGIVSTSQPSVGGVSPTPVPTYSATLCDLGVTYLLVVKVNVATGESSLILNPQLDAEPVTNLWSVNSWGTSALPTGGFKTINIRQGSATTAPTLKIDGIRVATSWASLFDPNAVVAGTSNPTAKSFNAYVNGKTLELDNVASGSTVEIFNALGAKLQSSTLVNRTIELNNTSKGLYVVRVGKSTQKFMIK